MSKVWFVTGSSRGLGREFVEAALSRGDRVAATARSAASLDDLVAAYGDAVLPLELDVTDRAAVFASVRRARERFGRLDVIVNNAGYAQVGGDRQCGHPCSQPGDRCVRQQLTGRRTRDRRRRIEPATISPNSPPFAHPSGMFTRRWGRGDR